MPPCPPDIPPCPAAPLRLRIAGLSRGLPAGRKAAPAIPRAALRPPPGNRLQVRNTR